MAQINLRIEDEIKGRAEMTLDDIGLSMSAAITVFLKAVSRENRIPFELSADPFYSKDNMDRLKKSIKQMEETGGTVHEVDLDD